MPLINTLIVWWSGAVVDIPTGWALCNGLNNLPDLRDQFIIGSGGALAQDDTGGSSPHTHGWAATGHRHSFMGGDDLTPGSGFSWTMSSAYPNLTFSNEPGLPAYYALALIGKI